MDHELPVISLLRGAPGYWRGFLIGVLLFVGAGWQSCLTVPRGTDREEALVTFFFIGRHDSVCLSGDFNGWSSESHCLQRKGEGWSIQLALPPGSYRYGFVIDKRDWAWDPGALIQEDDGFGKKNSLLLIDSAVTKGPRAP
jgi:Glycogen recognition site of AMP-activated protein kinase